MNQPTKNKRHIALFCGGRGSATIIKALLQWPHIHLTLLVNAYDDGLSTGALRDFISGMLGPSDFRKNLSYLLDPYSTGQYALRHLLEFRFPHSTTDADLYAIQHFSQTKQVAALTEPFQSLFKPISRALSHRLCSFLQFFFNYAATTPLLFDYKDCALGNLIFAGAYLEQKQNFNAATQEISALVSAQASLINVSRGEHRILVGLKADGELLMTEAQLVGVQSEIPIRDLFFMKHPIDLSLWQRFIDHSLEEKQAWLRAQEAVPLLSKEATDALLEADLILFGPGTQHSSLLPSYRIAEHVLKQTTAPVKAMVMNLGPDHDIQSLTTQDMINNALRYMGDPDNQHQVITHVLLHEPTDHALSSLHTYKQITLLHNTFAHPLKNTIHNGNTIVETILALWEHTNQPRHITLFVDLHARSLAITELYEELLQTSWTQVASTITLSINQANTAELLPTDLIQLQASNRSGPFPEIGYFKHWFQQEDSEYLVLLTGDGQYCFRDVLLAIKLLDQGQFGAVFGSRNQSRAQFQASLRAAYGERKLLGLLSFLSAFLISALFTVRYGAIFSDPLTGFRLFKRSRMRALTTSLNEKKITTPIRLATCLLKNNIDIAELPVTYRTFQGFVDPHWRIVRGLKNLMSLLT